MATKTQKATPKKAKSAVKHHKKVVQTTKAPEMRSFHPYKEPTNFLTTKPSIQSVYWFIIGVVVLALIGWVMALTVQIQSIYDAIELSDSTSSMMPLTK